MVSVNEKSTFKIGKTEMKKKIQASLFSLDLRRHGLYLLLNWLMKLLEKVLDFKKNI